MHHLQALLADAHHTNLDFDGRVAWENLSKPLNELIEGFVLLFQGLSRHAASYVVFGYGLQLSAKCAVLGSGSPKAIRQQHRAGLIFCRSTSYRPIVEGCLEVPWSLLFAAHVQDVRRSSCANM